MIIDMHASVVSNDPNDYAPMRALPHLVADPGECTVDNTLKRMDRVGVDRSVVWWIGATLEQCIRRNTFVADVAARHPDRFIPFATVQPADPDRALAEVDRAIVELGMAGVKLHPDVMQIALDDPRLLAVLERVRELDVPFVVHVNPTLLAQLAAADASVRGHDDDAIASTPRLPEADADRLAALVRTWDSTRVQSAHMGGVLLDDIQNSQITLQTAGAHSEVIEWAINRLGHERIVFGSDFPFFRVDDEVNKVRGLDIPSAQKDAILSGNALARVLLQNEALGSAE